MQSMLFWQKEKEEQKKITNPGAAVQPLLCLIFAFPPSLILRFT